MPFREGEVYRCPETNCGLELTVTNPALPTFPGPEALTCCGTTMVKTIPVGTTLR
jgi:hypothetical protein